MSLFNIPDDSSFHADGDDTHQEQQNNQSLTSAEAMFFTNDTATASTASIATLRSRYARQFREKFTSLFDHSIFNPALTTRFELTSTRMISDFFASCRRHRQEIINFSVRMKLKLSTEFLSDKQQQQQQQNENENHNEKNQQQQQYQMIERHGVFKIDSGINLQHSTTKRDILILICSSVCHFEQEQECHNNNNNNNNFCSYAENEISTNLLVLGFLLDFVNECIKSNCQRKKSEKVDLVTKTIFNRMMDRCRDVFFSNKNIVGDASTNITITQRTEQTLYSCREKTMDFIQQKFIPAFEKLCVASGKQEQKPRSDIDLVQMTTTGDDLLSSGEQVTEKLLRKLAELVFKSLQKGGFVFSVPSSSSSSSSSSSFDHLIPTCKLLLQCFGLAPFSRLIKIHQKNASAANVRFSFDHLTIIEVALMVFLSALFLGSSDDDEKLEGDGDDDDQRQKKVNRATISISSSPSSSSTSSSYLQCFFESMNQLRLNLHQEVRKSKVPASMTARRRPRTDENSIDDDDDNNQELVDVGNNQQQKNKNTKRRQKNKNAATTARSINNNIPMITSLYSSSGAGENVDYDNDNDGDQNSILVRFYLVVPGIVFLLRHWKPLFVTQRRGFLGGDKQNSHTTNDDNENNVRHDDDNGNDSTEATDSSSSRNKVLKITSKTNNKFKKFNNSLPLFKIVDFEEEASKRKQELASAQGYRQTKTRKSKKEKEEELNTHSANDQEETSSSSTNTTTSMMMDLFSAFGTNDENYINTSDQTLKKLQLLYDHEKLMLGIMKKTVVRDNPDGGNKNAVNDDDDDVDDDDNDDDSFVGSKSTSLHRCYTDSESGEDEDLCF